MTEKRIETLLYGGTRPEIGDFVISSSFDALTCEKNIEVLNNKTRKISYFIVNGMTCDESKEKLFSIVA